MNTKILKVTIVIVLCFLTLSCKKKQNCFGVYMDETFTFYVRDSAGNDLLDPSNPNGYNIDSIRVYYLLTDGTLHKGQTYYEFEKGVARNPGDYELMRSKDGYVLDFILRTLHSKKSDHERPKMYIDWNDSDRDTIKAKLITRRGDPKDTTDAGYCIFAVWDTIWYNGKLIAADWKKTMLQGFVPPVIIKGGNK